MTLNHAPSLPLLQVEQQGSAMHVVTSLLYGLVVWLALLAWAIIAGTPGSVLVVVALSPFVISGVIVLLLVGWLAWCAIRWLWLNRATLRLRRSQSA